MARRRALCTFIHKKDSHIASENHTLQTILQTLNAGNTEQAESQILQVLQDQSTNIDALYLGAVIAYRRNDTQTALSRLQAGLTRAPMHFEMLNLLGQVQKQAHDFVRAEKAFRSALSVKSDFTTARRNLIFHLIDISQPHLALSEISKLTKAEQGAPKLALAKIICLKDCQHLEAARAELDAFEKRTGKKYGLLRGQILTTLGDYEGALRAYGSVAQDAPEKPQSLKNSAQVLAMTGQWKAAKKQLLETTKTAAPQAQAAIAECFIKTQDLSRAKKVIKSALKSSPDHPSLLKAQSETALQKGDKQEAYTRAKAALTLVPGQLDLMTQFARASLAVQKYDDVLVAAESALKIVPNDQFWIAMLATGGRGKAQNYQYYFDYEALVRPYDLSPPPGYKTIESYNAALSKALGELHIFKAAPLDQSLRLGTQTEFDLRFAKSSVVQTFFKMIDAPIRDYMATVNVKPPHPIARRNSGNYRISGAWSVKLKKGGFHVNHVHPQGWLSSSYYVEVPPEVATSKHKEGWIQFGQPPVDISDMPPEYSVEPKAGRLVLFPSYMWHGTVPIKGKDPRLTLPFDVIPA